MMPAQLYLCNNRTNASQELQDLVQQQQKELQQLQQQQQQRAADAAAAATSASQQQQLEAANAELRQQLQGATSRLQEVEAAMHKVMEQQVRLWMCPAAVQRMLYVCHQHCCHLVLTLESGCTSVCKTCFHDGC
jgi:hypothetical protein